jgi:hypothetical protein
MLQIHNTPTTGSFCDNICSVVKQTGVQEMQKAYRHLVKHALGLGHVISVWDGGEWQVKKSNKLKTITDAIESVEEAQIRIRDAAGQSLGWALISAYGLQPDETVVDSDAHDFMNEWWDLYEATL